MSNADMIRYCDEALAWEDFGPVDIYFFESVKKILLGQCSAFEAPDLYGGDLMGIERPVSDTELEPEYPQYPDIYYSDEGDDEIPDYSSRDRDEAFAQELFSTGFFQEPIKNNEESSHEESSSDSRGETSNGTFKVQI